MQLTDCCSFSHFATADEFTDTTLRVITIEKRQYGNYSCKAANKLGTSQQWVELFGKCVASYFVVLSNSEAEK